MISVVGILQIKMSIIFHYMLLVGAVGIFGEVYIDKKWFNHGACICLASVGTIKTFLK